MDRDEKVKLLPCPFCGVIPELKDNGDCASITCLHWDCLMDEVSVSEDDYDSVMPSGWCRNSVIEKWNARQNKGNL